MIKLHLMHEYYLYKNEFNNLVISFYVSYGFLNQTFLYYLCVSVTSQTCSLSKRTKRNNNNNNNI